MPKKTATRRARGRTERLDYRHWGLMSYWSLDDAAALLLKVDPVAVHDNQFREAAIFERFTKLQTLALRSFEMDELKERNSPTAILVWAHRKRIRIPRALRNAVDLTAEKLELGNRERNTLLKLVIGMAAKGYAYNPAAAKSSSIAKIESDLLLIGLPLGRETIRSHLQEGAKLLEPNALAAKTP